MTSASSKRLITFTSSTRAAFLEHLREKPSDRRVSQSDKENLIEWLTSPHKRPASQKEFSRRNYVLKTFAWDEKTQTLFASAKMGADKDRTVVIEDMIADIVGFVHEGNHHAGWDTTWKDVSNSYYGILRSDVIFLLKQCQKCASNPSKRPKGCAFMSLSSQPVGHEALDFVGTGDGQYNVSAWEIMEEQKRPGE